jgi:hypothetical protein
MRKAGDAAQARPLFEKDSEGLEEASGESPGCPDGAASPKVFAGRNGTEKKNANPLDALRKPICKVVSKKGYTESGGQRKRAGGVSAKDVEIFCGDPMCVFWRKYFGALTDLPSKSG